MNAKNLLRAMMFAAMLMACAETGFSEERQKIDHLIPAEGFFTSLSRLQKVSIKAQQQLLPKGHQQFYPTAYPDRITLSYVVLPDRKLPYALTIFEESGSYKLVGRQAESIADNGDYEVSETKAVISEGLVQRLHEVWTEMLLDLRFPSNGSLPIELHASQAYFLSSAREGLILHGKVPPVSARVKEGRIQCATQIATAVYSLSRSPSPRQSQIRKQIEALLTTFEGLGE